MKNYASLLLLLSTLLLGCSEKTKNRPEEPEDSSGIIRIEGTDLRYVIEGEGEVCLVIGSSVYYPRTFSQELREHFKFYFVDMRWFAEKYEPVSPENFTIETIASDIEQIRKTLGLHKPMILGHSIHGTIALEYAKRYPENISSVIIIGSPSMFGNDRFEQAFTDLWATASKERKEIHKQNLAEIPGSNPGTDKGFIDDYIATTAQYWYDPHYDARWLWDGMAVHTDLINHLFGNIFGSFDMFEGDWKLSVPVLVVMGKYDYVIPYTLWDSSYAQLSNYNKVLFDKSGHTPQLEEADRFDEVLINWLGSNQ